MRPAPRYRWWFNLAFIATSFWVLYARFGSTWLITVAVLVSISFVIVILISRRADLANYGSGRTTVVVACTFRGKSLVLQNSRRLPRGYARPGDDVDAVAREVIARVFEQRSGGSLTLARCGVETDNKLLGEKTVVTMGGERYVCFLRPLWPHEFAYIASLEAGFTFISEADDVLTFSRTPEETRTIMAALRSRVDKREESMGLPIEWTVEREVGDWKRHRAWQKDFKFN